MTPPRVLIVDDDEPVLRVQQRLLSQHGFEIETAASGDAALNALRLAPFDVIVSDIDMPGMNGIRLLEYMRSYDVDVPVVLLTGAPSVETAVQALEHGAVRYLIKPAGARDLVKAASDAVRLHRLAVAKRQALSLTNMRNLFTGDQAGLSVSFDRALASMRLAYQPIRSVASGRIAAFEALLRSSEANLATPAAVLDAAERLGRVHDVGWGVRDQAMQAVAQFPRGVDLFLNIHPLDLLDDRWVSFEAPGEAGGTRLALEITERAPLHAIPDVRRRTRALRDRGFRLALDDFGAGFGGLTTFALLEPDVVKIDAGLVQGIETETVKQSVVKTLVQMCGDLGIVVIAEGVETVAQRDELIAAGCDLMQGFLFGRPALSLQSDADAVTSPASPS